MSVGRRRLLGWFAGGIGLVPVHLAVRTLLDLFGIGAATEARRIFLGTVKEVTDRLEAGRGGYYVDERRKLLVMRAGPPGAPSLSVYSLVCTHLGCTLRPGKDERFLECPCHGSKFNFLDPQQAGVTCGRVHQGPATADLTRFQIVVVRDRIYLHA